MPLLRQHSLNVLDKFFVSTELSSSSCPFPSEGNRAFVKVSVICCFSREGVIGPKLNLLPTGTGGLFSVWTLPLDQSGKVEPARDQGPSRHSSKGHWASQASPPRQGDNPRRSPLSYSSHDFKPISAQVLL